MGSSHTAGWVRWVRNRQNCENISARHEEWAAQKAFQCAGRVIRSAPGKDVSRNLRQVLAYGLAARADNLEIDTIGIYHANEALLVARPLASVIDPADVDERHTGPRALRDVVAEFSRKVRQEGDDAARR